MTEDSVTEITTQSWGSRIGNSLKGIVIGIVLICVAIGVLWWNEGRAVKRAQALEEGAGQVVSIAADSIEPAHEGGLVHLSGLANTEEVLIDPEFNVQAQAIKLIREVQMYQWRQHQKSETREKLGGGTETITTYRYDKGWETSPISSANFKRPEGHQNPSQMPYGQWRDQARDVSLGAFRLSSSLISQINRSTPVRLDGNEGIHLPSRSSQLNGNEIYVGAHPQDPQIGDLKIRFSAVLPTEVSVVAVQRGKSFMPYFASNGNKIELLEYGSQSAQQMFQAAQDRNNLLTWILRAGGFLFIFIGLRMLLGVVPILAAVIPALGGLVDAAVGLIAFALSAAISLLTIAIAWVFYRPILAVGLLLGAVLMTTGLIWAKSAKKERAIPQMDNEAIATPPLPPSV
jgi:hypothetical protein